MTTFGYAGVHHLRLRGGLALQLFANKDVTEGDRSIPEAKQLQSIFEENVRGVRADFASLRMQAQRHGQRGASLGPWV